MIYEYGLFYKAITRIYEGPYESKVGKKGIVSSIADEGLPGMGVRILGAEENGYLPIMTHYEYTGYVKKEEILLTSLEGVHHWETSCLMVIDTSSADVLTIPSVQGVCLQTLYKGSLVQLLEWEEDNSGWARIRLADGQYGYVRNQFLEEKRFSQAGLWKENVTVLLQEEVFRESVVREARKYLGTQYRWGGKSTQGIDCSGLTSMCYMLYGVLLYRDAKIMEGFPIKEIPITQIKKGDLLYFPGHIAMYLGEERYIHSTARKGSGGVVINSFNPKHADYREDLVESLYAAGSIFV